MLILGKHHPILASTKVLKFCFNSKSENDQELDLELRFKSFIAPVTSPLSELTKSSSIFYLCKPTQGQY